MKEFFQRVGMQAARHIQSRLSQVPDRMFSVGGAILKVDGKDSTMLGRVVKKVK